MYDKRLERVRAIRATEADVGGEDIDVFAATDQELDAYEARLDARRVEVEADRERARRR